ncbi:hypothetical protein BST83_12180 [Polaribacter filamentus]|uniref:Uncharacterized protein n=1 Tax=Polaribacter filamentus TaxID=53483 RepID=A0A2S7KZ01_9FLAO|nr:hypothetical protein BST83_12180 [Polaribacter filamentus]
MLIYGFLAMIFVLFFANTIISYLSNEIFLESTVTCFKIMSISLLLLALTSSKGTLTLVAYSCDKSFTKGIIYSFLFYFMLILILYYFNYINLITLAFAIVFSIVVELLSHVYQINKNNISRKI